MATTELRIGGFGGQGVILSGMIIGKAAALHADLNATLIQAFGPEARGSACSAQLVISDSPVLYPYVTKSDIQVMMSQEAFRKFTPELAEDGILVYEEELVEPEGLPPTVKTYAIPATRFAEELGRTIVLNIVMVGFFTAVTGLIDPDAMRKALLDSVPPGTESLNSRAFEKGYEYGLEKVAATASA